MAFAWRGTRPIIVAIFIFIVFFIFILQFLIVLVVRFFLYFRVQLYTPSIPGSLHEHEIQNTYLYSLPGYLYVLHIFCSTIIPYHDPITFLSGCKEVVKRVWSAGVDDMQFNLGTELAEPVIMEKFNIRAYVQSNYSVKLRISYQLTCTTSIKRGRKHWPLCILSTPCTSSLDHLRQRQVWYDA